jgi:hypothetical protein
MIQIEITPNGQRALKAPPTSRGPSVLSKLVCAVRKQDWSLLRKIANRSRWTRVSPANVTGKIRVSYGCQCLAVLDVPGTWQGMGQALALDLLVSS